MIRAIRRHHYSRLKKRRKDYYGWGDYEYIMTPRQLGMVTSTPQSCSCVCCGNPRKHWKAKTRKEMKAYLDYIEQCYEADVYVRDSGKLKFNQWW